jgi:hypothetical protein
MWTRLAERKIAAQDDPSGSAKSLGYGDEQRRSAVCARAVRQNKASFRRTRGTVQEAAHRHGIGYRIEEFLIAAHC